MKDFDHTFHIDVTVSRSVKRYSKDSDDGRPLFYETFSYLAMLMPDSADRTWQAKACAAKGTSPLDAVKNLLGELNFFNHRLIDMDEDTRLVE